jgi:DNA-directed RNA polymerase specialized sigma24 family protein
MILLGGIIDDTYPTLRQKLELFFRHRGCAGSDVDDLVSESVMRVLTKTGEGVTVREPMAYAFGVAKNILHEFRSRPERAELDIDDIAETIAFTNSEAEDRELQYRCYSQCFERLSRRNQLVIRDCLQREPPLPASLRVRKHRIIHSYLVPCCRQCRERGERSPAGAFTDAAKSR